MPYQSETPVSNLSGPARRWDPLWLFVCAAAIVIGLVVRIVLLNRYYLIPDGDQSVLGLMARHVLQGERPVFYWGQSYTGSGEAYVTAALFRVFGQSNFLLHLAPLTASALFTVLTAAVAWRLYGPVVASLTCAFLGVGPTMLVDWSFWAGSGYLEAMAAGAAALLLVLPSGGARSSAPRLLACFFLLGLAVWIQPTGAYYVIAVLAALSGRISRLPRRLGAWTGRSALAILAAAAFCTGASPLLVYNLQHDWATLTFLSNHTTDAGLPTVLARALLWADPVILGFLPPTSDRAYFLQFILDHLVLYGVSVAIILLLLFRGLSLWRLALQRLRLPASEQATGDLALAVLVIAVFGGYLCTGWGGESWSGSQPRYLLPLYSAVPLAIRVALPLRPRFWQWAIAWLAVLGIAGVGIAVNTTTFARRDLSPLATVLETHGIRAVYGDYWLVYPLTFASAEQVVGVAVNDDLSKGVLDNRYSPYLRAAAATPDFAWIAATGSKRQQSILHCLAQVHSRYSVVTWQDQTIIIRPSGRAFPWWNGGRCSTVT
jgi:4-amino-4-deoxy-L-arabinose transferase-like glycosyltransferase